MTTGPRSVLANVPTAVYRFSDAQGQLLYVGITHDLDERWRTHERSQPWWLDVAQREFVWYATRAEAERIEATAAATEKPRYDRSGKRTRGGEVDQRLEVEVSRAIHAVSEDIAKGTYPLWRFLPSCDSLSRMYGIPFVGINKGLLHLANHEHTLVRHQEQFAVSLPRRQTSQDSRRLGLLFFLASNAFGDSSFTLTDLMEATGAARGTSYQHVKLWREADRVECLGQVPGRRALIYRIIRHPEPDPPQVLAFWGKNDIQALTQWLYTQLDADDAATGEDTSRDRSIIEACSPTGSSVSAISARVLKVLARRYANRPGCLPEWGITAS